MEGRILNEQRRLIALESYNIFDTPREQDFDDLAELATIICGTPMAAISLIGDGRQFFKAEIGLGVRGTPLDGFCAQMILQHDMVVIADTAIDQRLSSNPLFAAHPDIRFYAGATLRSVDGTPIGTVSTFGHEPKELTEAQQSALRALARQVMVQLEYRRTLHSMKHDLALERRLSAQRHIRASKASAKSEELRVNEARITAAQDAGRIGTFEVDIETNQLIVSDEFCRIFGVPEQRNYTTQAIESLIIDEDRAIASAPDSRRAGTAPLNVEYRIRRQNDRRICWIARRARFVEDESGNLGKMVGVVIDVTDTKRKDTRIAALLSLGDRLRAGTTVEDIERIAGEILAEGLGVPRAGYMQVEKSKDNFRVECDYASPESFSISGIHSLRGLAASVNRLRHGDAIAVSQVSAASWLNGDTAWYQANAVAAFVNIPIIEKEDVVGVFFAHDSVPRFWSKLELDFAWGVADRAYAAIAKLKAEADQRILNQELSHRLKNTFSIVQAIASQTLRGVTEKEAVSAFNGRLHALSSAHDVLLRKSLTSASLQDVVATVVLLHADEKKVTISGPDVPLGPKAGLSLSMLLHELGTNAVKYGSLSAETGTIAISWTVSNDGERSILTLQWQELGGPPAVEPKRQGFGSRLIRMGIVGTGDVEKHFTDAGLVATFRAPMSMIAE